MAEQTANVVELLVEAAKRTPDRAAIVVDRAKLPAQRMTFGELWERVDRLGCSLARLGVSREDRVVLMVPMSIDLYVNLLAVLKIGAAAVFVDPWIGRRQIAAFAAFAEPRAFIGVGKAHLLRVTDARLRRIPISVTTGSRWFGLIARHRLARLLDHDGDGRLALVASDEPALITFTTGSSGEPKGTNRTHGYLVAQHAALQTEFPYRNNDVDLTMFPVFALNNLAKGITTVVPPIDFRKVAQADGAAVLRQIRNESVTTVTASPPLIDRICHALAGGNVPGSLRRVLVGGAPVSDDQLRLWQQRLPAVEIVVVYGSTEAEPVAHISAAERLAVASDRRPALPGYCTGRPTALLETKVIKIAEGPVSLREGDWQPWEVADGEIGELVVAGNHVGRDYFRNPAAVAANKITDADGRVWHRMGDTGYFDSHGRFWLTGRVHSTIRRRGELVHPQLVEQAVCGDGVARAAALGIEDAQLGERLAIVVQTPDTSRRMALTVANRLRERSIDFDEILLTSRPLPVDPRHNSKIDYTQLRSVVCARHPDPSLARWSSGELAESSDGEVG